MTNTLDAVNSRRDCSASMCCSARWSASPIPRRKITPARWCRPSSICTGPDWNGSSTIWRRDRRVLDTCAGDEVVAGLLLLHGLHPLDVETRVRQALESVRPLLRSHGGNVELLEVREGVVRLRLCKATATAVLRRR